MVDGNKLANVGFNYLGTPYSTMDCQAFVEQCLRDCGMNKDLAGSNAWYREVNNNGKVMTPEECVKQLGTVPPGAFLFILKHDGGEPEKYKPDGLGNASHIGICTGCGEGAIHSSQSRGCVAESKFQNKTIPNGGWNMVGLWDKVAYDYSPSPSPSPEPGPEPEPSEYATVYAESGSTVKMRAEPSTSCNLYWDVPIGTVVDLLRWGDDWSKIKWSGITGYMMSKFLIRGEVTPGEDDPVEGDEDDLSDTIMVSRIALEDLYMRIGELLGIRG